ncbi:MAG: leucyl/phenylalanyl-tRNA--protein transferase [Arenicellaceae bacterium]|nr:leucyl/phenylalanyl-tRNA--protein transferase [Arenicellaceae bacterium]
MKAYSSKHLGFPDPRLAGADGLLAAGGNLESHTLLEAYRSGIFPWFNEDQPILWWSPDPRTVIFPEDIHISRSLRRFIRQTKLTLSCDQDFEGVLEGCAQSRAQQREPGTWITGEMKSAYKRLFENQHAHSIEVWQENQLVGGLYGVSVGKVFFGESMFSAIGNASKLVLVSVCKQLSEAGFELIDCQVSSPHLLSMGARELARDDYLCRLEQAAAIPTDQTAWLTWPNRLNL